ncbi:MAG TPA: hypothetical protein VLJ42_08185 [Solirubrobacteraceae bacterium]|nr:hypothetical protein [Solirubrobacteraceae bacterium]
MALLTSTLTLLALGPVDGSDLSTAHAAKTSQHSLLQSRQLWATVNLCNPKDKPNWIGIRGSMPGDGHPGERMYMRFRVQYRDANTGRWVDVAQGADSGFLALGAATRARQSGHSFQLVPAPGKSAFELRGTVSYQWRRGTHVVHSVSRTTTAGHRSLAGADPPGFTAATCTLS